MSRTPAETMPSDVAAAFVHDVLEQMTEEEADALLQTLAEERRKARLDRLLAVLETGTLYGWYSAEQFALCGGAMWTRPDGTEVLISMVSSTYEHGSRWADISYQGVVVQQGQRLPPSRPSIVSSILSLSVATSRTGAS